MGRELLEKYGVRCAACNGRQASWEAASRCCLKDGSTAPSAAKTRKKSAGDRLQRQQARVTENPARCCRCNRFIPLYFRVQIGERGKPQCDGSIRCEAI